MNSSPQCKLLPYLGSKTKLFQGLSFPKFLVKCSDYLSQQKLHNVSVRTISSKACLIPSENTTNPFQTEHDTSRSRSLDPIRPTTNPNLLTLPPLETTQTMHSDNENQVENDPIEVVQTEPNGAENSNSNSKKRVKIIKIKAAPALSINRAPPKLIKGIKSFKLEPGFMPKMVKAGSVPNAQTANKFFDFSNVTRTVNKEDLTRMFYNTPSQNRAKLPLLIIHFEGIIGSCLVQVKRGNGESSSSGSTGFYKDYFIKKDAKDELKGLAKQFLIAVVMSNSSEKSKKMMKLFINRKYPFDACYYKTKEQDGITAKDIAGFILDYDSIVSDFRAYTTNKKVIIVSSIDMSSQIIRRDFLADTEIHRPLYNKSSLLSFFPKINKIAPENLKIVCLPNFLLQEKYEDYRKLIKSLFSPVSKLILQLLKNLEGTPGETSQGAGFNVKKDTENPEEENEINQDYIETDSGGTDVESGEKLVLLNFTEFIKELEKTQKLNTHRKEFEKIKERNSLTKEQAAGAVIPNDVGPIRQRIINEMMENLQTRENVTNLNMTKMNVMNTVTNLVSNNAYIFRNKFKNHQTTISEVTEYLQVDNEDEVNIDQKDEDPEILLIEHIKQMSLLMKVFLDD